MSGFDIIYSLQDENFDKQFKLHSIPVIIGKNYALLLSRVLHIITSLIIIIIGIYYFEDSTIFWIATILFIFLLGGIERISFVLNDTNQLFDILCYLFDLQNLFEV